MSESIIPTHLPRISNTPPPLTDDLEDDNTENNENYVSFNKIDDNNKSDDECEVFETQIRPKEDEIVIENKETKEEVKDLEEILEQKPQELSDLNNEYELKNYDNLEIANINDEEPPDWFAFDQEVVEETGENEFAFTDFKNDDIQKDEKRDEEKKEEEDEWDDFISNEVEKDDFDKFDMENFDVALEQALDKIQYNVEFINDPDDICFNKAMSDFDKDIQEMWNTFMDINNCDLLKFQFKNSFIESKYYDALNIDRSSQAKSKNQRNYAILFSDDEDENENTSKDQKISDNKKKSRTIKDKETQNEEKSQDTVVQISALELDFSYLEKQPTNVTQQKQTEQNTGDMSTLLNDLLADIYPTTTTTASVNTSDSLKINQLNDTLSLSKNAHELLDKLPNLSFMKSNILMIPVMKGDDEKNELNLF